MRRVSSVLPSDTTMISVGTPESKFSRREPMKASSWGPALWQGRTTESSTEDRSTVAPAVEISSSYEPRPPIGRDQTNARDRAIGLKWAIDLSGDDVTQLASRHCVAGCEGRL